MGKSGKNMLIYGGIVMVLLVLVPAYDPSPTPAAPLSPLDLQTLNPDRPAGRQFLVLIAIDNYRFQPQLQYEVWRIRRLKQVLTSRYIFDQVIELYDYQATGGRIIALLAKLQRELQPRDSLLLLFFAAGRCGPDAKEGYWLAADAIGDKPSDPGRLSHTRIRDALCRLPAAHLLVISDGPFAGGLVSKRRRAEEKLGAHSHAEDDTVPCRHIVFCGGEGQSVRSSFAAGLKKILDRNNSLYMDGTELHDALRAKVGRPAPVFGAMNGTGSRTGAEFLFYLQPGMVGKDLDRAAYEQAERGGTLVDFTRYILRFPAGKHMEAAMLKRADLFSKAGRFRRASAEYARALRLNPNLDCAYASIGYCRQQIGEFARAVAAYNKALEISPLDKGYFFNRGCAYRSLGQYEQAIADYKQAMQLDPNYAQAFNNLAAIQAARYDYAGALTNLDIAIAADPAMAEAYINRGRVQGFLRKFDFALQDLQAALQLAPENIDAAGNMVDLYALMGEYDKAIELAGNRIREKSGHGLFYVSRGYAYYKKGEYKLALADLNAGIRMNPRCEIAYLDRGLVYLDMMLGAIKKEPITAGVASCGKRLVQGSPRFFVHRVCLRVLVGVGSHFLLR